MTPLDTDDTHIHTTEAKTENETPQKLHFIYYFYRKSKSSFAPNVVLGGTTLLAAVAGRSVAVEVLAPAGEGGGGDNRGTATLGVGAKGFTGGLLLVLVFLGAEAAAGGGRVGVNNKSGEEVGWDTG